MKIQSLVNHEGHLEIVEVEIELVPGLPQMHFLGLADQGIKESIHRIKCALRQQGFAYPRTKQILVNLRPAHFRKSSRGLELAVAMGLLLKTGQLKAELFPESIIAYGELSLAGEVKEPSDLRRFANPQSDQVISGKAFYHQGFADFWSEDLKGLSALQRVHKEEKIFWQRPQNFLEYQWSGRQAEWLLMMAVGGHHSLVAGPAGWGKTTLARALWELLEEPTQEWVCEYQKYFEALSWRPYVDPHHSITRHGLLGGGRPVLPGEITRADGGLLVLDEMLEFEREALESLREPMLDGKISLMKGHHRASLQARFQLVGTTNFCPCGEWIPGNARNCYFSRSHCFSTLRKLTGPLLDRFDILYFMQGGEQRKVRQQEILEKLKDIWAFKKTLSSESLMIPVDLLELHGLHLLSHRRKLSIERVARTLATIDLSPQIESQHIESARKWALGPFEKLKEGIS